MRGGNHRTHWSPGGCALLSRPQSNPILRPKPKQVAYSIYKKDPIFVFHHAHSANMPLLLWFLRNMK